MDTTDDIARFPGGVGAIVPTDRYSDEEVVQSVEASQKEIEDPAVVCLDERRSILAVLTEGAETEPVREELAGGNLNTFVTAAAAIGWSGFSKEALDAGPSLMTKEAADFLVDELDEALGAHRHADPQAVFSLIETSVGATTATGGGLTRTEVDAAIATLPKPEKNQSGCGAIDKGSDMDGNTRDHAMDEPVIEQAKIDLGEMFNVAHWQKSRDGFAAMTEDSRWVDWDRTQIQDEVLARDGTVETLDASGDVFADDDDPNAAARHGHWGEAAKINAKSGQSNDRDRAEIPAFQVDVDPMVRMARAGATEEEFSLLLHAMVMRQYFTTYRLTDNMRIIR